jgi:hypothetical protein
MPTIAQAQTVEAQPGYVVMGPVAQGSPGFYVGSGYYYCPKATSMVGSYIVDARVLPEGQFMAFKGGFWKVETLDPDKVAAFRKAPDNQKRWQVVFIPFYQPNRAIEPNTAHDSYSRQKRIDLPYLKGADYPYPVVIVGQKPVPIFHAFHTF